MKWTKTTWSMVRAMLFCCSATLTALGTNSAQADLSDEGFDTVYVVNSFLPNFLPLNTTAVDKWAAEKSFVVTAGDGITPVDGDQMVKMLDDGSSGVKNELKQRIDVTLEIPLIDAGQARSYYFACFNVPSGAANARAEIFLKYLDVSGSLLSSSAVLNTDDNGGLDQDISTWEHLDFLSDPVPVGTRYVEAWIRYDNASLGAFAGYLDKTHLEFRGVPEPAALALVLTACGCLARRRRSSK